MLMFKDISNCTLLTYNIFIFKFVVICQSNFEMLYLF